LAIRAGGFLAEGSGLDLTGVYRVALASALTQGRRRCPAGSVLYSVTSKCAVVQRRKER
jgi:hypothetical protein